MCLRSNSAVQDVKYLLSDFITLPVNFTLKRISKLANKMFIEICSIGIKINPMLTCLFL
jgi:hypothetical protein